MEILLFIPREAGLLILILLLCMGILYVVRNKDRKEMSVWMKELIAAQSDPTGFQYGNLWDTLITQFQASHKGLDWRVDASTIMFQGHYRNVWNYERLMDELSLYFDDITVHLRNITNDKATELTWVLTKAGKQVWLYLQVAHRSSESLDPKDMVENEEDVIDGKLWCVTNAGFAIPNNGYELKRKEIQKAFESCQIKITEKPKESTSLAIVPGPMGMEVQSITFKSKTVMPSLYPVKVKIPNHEETVMLASSATKIIKTLFDRGMNVFIQGKPGSGKTAFAAAVLEGILKVSEKYNLFKVSPNHIDGFLSNLPVLAASWPAKIYFDAAFEGTNIIFVEDAGDVLRDPESQLKSAMAGDTADTYKLRWIFTGDSTEDVSEEMLRPGRLDVVITCGPLTKDQTKAYASGIKNSLPPELHLNDDELNEVLEKETVSPKDHAQLNEIWSTVSPQAIDRMLELASKEYESAEKADGFVFSNKPLEIIKTKPREEPVKEESESAPAPPIKTVDGRLPKGLF